MAVKFPLEVKNGVKARNITELKENFDVEKVIGYFLDGKLKNWLDARYYEEEAEAMERLSENDAELGRKLCSIFDVEYDLKEIDQEEIAKRNERLAKLKQFTSDEEVIENIDSVAFDQEELTDLYDKGVEKIYLCAGEFIIPKSKQDLEYVVLGDIHCDGLKKDEITVFENIEKSGRLRRKEDEQLERGKELYFSCNLDAAFKYFKQLAENGNARAMYFMGEYYCHGYGSVKKNEDMALEWRRKGAEAGDVLAALNIAYSLPANDIRRKETFEKYFDNVEELAEAGDILAQSELADLYGNGNGCIMDEAIQIKWLECSSLYWRSMIKLGNIYCKYNECEKAYQLFKSVAEKSIAEAQYKLGCCLQCEKCLCKNDKEGYEWFNVAAKQQYAAAENRLGMCCLDGIGTSKDDFWAYNHFEKAAELGNVSALWNLGWCHENYRAGRPCSLTDAYDYYMKAAEKGDMAAIEKIADDYFGKGSSEKKNEEALYWYYKMLEPERGYSEIKRAYAMRRIAECYYFKGVEFYKDAVKWYKCAAELNEYYAKEWIKNNAQFIAEHEER